MINLEQLCKDVCQLTQDVGGFIKHELGAFNVNAIEIKGKNDFVSYVDKKAEAMLCASLSQMLPTAGYYAEEGTSTLIGDVYNWVIDPLDGTTNFIHGLPIFAISVALMRNEEVILGVVHEINFNETFYAWENSSAYLNSTVILPSKISTLNGALIATGFPYSDFTQLDSYLHFLTFLLKETNGVRRFGAASVDIAYVACGRFDAFYEYGLKPWDVAAGAFILKQAGGKVSDFQGGSNFIFGKELIACNPSIYSEFHRQFTSYFKPTPR